MNNCDNNRNAGLRIRNKRKELKKSVMSVSEITGLSIQTINQIESGTRTFRTDTLTGLCVALGISADYVLGLKPTNVLDNICAMLCSVSESKLNLIESIVHCIVDASYENIFQRHKYFASPSN